MQDLDTILAQDEDDDDDSEEADVGTSNNDGNRLMSELAELVRKYMPSANAGAPQRRRVGRTNGGGDCASLLVKHAREHNGDMSSLTMTPR